MERVQDAAKTNPNAIPPRRDLRLEALTDILHGDLKVHAHSYRADEILMLIRAADELGFKIHTFQHVLEGYKVADEMAKHGAMASTFADMWAYKVEAWDAIPFNMALMSERGVMVSVNSDSDERIRRLYQEAGVGVRYGNMRVNEALKMITLNPAKQLGVDKMVGSLEVGKDGDIAIFSAHPFAPGAMAEYTIIDGKVYFDRSEANTLRKTAAQTGGPGGSDDSLDATRRRGVDRDRRSPSIAMCASVARRGRIVSHSRRNRRDRYWGAAGQHQHPHSQRPHHADGHERHRE